MKSAIVPKTATIAKTARKLMLPINQRTPMTGIPNTNKAIAINMGIDPKAIRMGPEPKASGPKQIKRENEAKTAKAIRNMHKLC